MSLASNIDFSDPVMSSLFKYFSENRTYKRLYYEYILSLFIEDNSYKVLEPQIADLNTKIINIDNDINNYRSQLKTLEVVQKLQSSNLNKKTKILLRAISKCESLKEVFKKDLTDLHCAQSNLKNISDNLHNMTIPELKSKCDDLILNKNLKVSDSSISLIKRVIRKSKYNSGIANNFYSNSRRFSTINLNKRFF
uniref:hypothetical protein 9 n=1 Tax=Moniliophthora perniciosa TaxID=153609 RepID=UPI0000242342|nr:hypothetical protein 9 [Moniliophthora perniciosa]AAQ74299.1 hypothetical protein 9 [Moniliophthora perniciosa]